jgi:hypothetical protein
MDCGRGVSLWGAALGIFALGSACGGGSKGVSAGSPCSQDTDCGSGKICHPVAKVCVQTCNSPADCPITADVCNTYSGPNGAATSDEICMCSSDQMCQGTSGSNVICGLEDKICETPCTSNSACSSSRTCDTGSGQCITQDATCVPACTTGQYCDTTQDPAACANFCTPGSCLPQNCDYGTGECVAVASCTPGNPQPDVCPYGDDCTAGATCTDVAPPACTNFNPSVYPDTWAIGSNEPVIYSMGNFSVTPASTFCQGFTRFEAHVMAYSPMGVFPISSDCPSPTGTQDAGEIALQSMIHLVDPNGNEIDTAETVFNLCTTNSGMNAEFDVNYCGAPGTTSYSGGIVFLVNGMSGNEYCAVIQ